MANINKSKGTIAILTGGGDVPGLNPAIRGVTMQAHRKGYRVIGLRRGWAGITEMSREENADNSNCWLELTEEVVKRSAREGGTFLHTSRTRPSHMKKGDIPAQYQSSFASYLREDTKDEKEADKRYDLTPEVINNLDHLGVDYLIPIGGDDTLSYGVRLAKEGVKVVAIPKTMDNDVPGTDYCIGFSTCVSRTIQLANDLRTAAGSHERVIVMEVFGRNAGFTAMVPTMAGAADRCVIPEVPFDIDRLCQLLVEDRNNNPSNYSSVLVSEGAMFKGGKEIHSNEATDAFGHAKLGGIGAAVAKKLKELFPKYNKGRKIDIIEQNLGYAVRCGRPDAIDSIAPMAFGNLALDLIGQGIHNRLVVLSKGRYDNLPLDIVTHHKKVVNAERYYNSERMRPNYDRMTMNSLFMVTTDEYRR